MPRCENDNDDDDLREWGISFVGGLAECSEENLEDKMTIEHIANQCCVHFASCRINCEIETKLSSETVACLNELNKLSPHQFAQVFKAAGEENPNILLHEEVQRDCNNLKEWSAAAPKEIRQLKRKGVWTECLESEADGEQIIPCTFLFKLSDFLWCSCEPFFQVVAVSLNLLMQWNVGILLTCSLEHLSKLVWR